MDLTLSKVDYLQVAPISNRRTLKVLPLGKKKRQRFVVGDDSGAVGCYSVKKGAHGLEFKLDSVEKEIGCVELGGSVGAKDKIFVAYGSSIMASTRKGKVFFRFDTPLTEKIRSMFVEDTKIFTGGEFIFNEFDDGKDTNFFLSPDAIHAITADRVTRDTRKDILLACQDRTLRVIQDSHTVRELPLPGPPTCLHARDAADMSKPERVIVYGTSNGIVGAAHARDGAIELGWTLAGDEAAGPVSAVTMVDLTEDGVEDVVVARGDGALQVFGFDVSDVPDKQFQSDVGESIRSIDHGRIAAPEFREVLCCTYSGRVVAFTSEPLHQRDREDAQGRSKAAVRTEGRIARLRSEIAQLQAKRDRERERMRAMSSEDPVQHDVKVETVFELVPEEAAYRVTLETPTPIDRVALKCSVPATLLDVERSGAVLATTPPDAAAGNALLATFRPSEPASRVEFKIRAVEGQYGTLSAAVVAAVQPPTARVVTMPIKPLSLHHRVHSLTDDEQARMGNTLTLTGAFSFAQMHEWVSFLLPEVPQCATEESAALHFRNAFLGGVLTARFREGEAVLSSDSASTIAIAKEVVTKQATERMVRVSSAYRVSTAAAHAFLRLIHPKLEYQVGLVQKVQMIEALKEVKLQEGDISFMSEAFREVLDNEESIRREYKNQPKALEALYGVVSDLFVDFHKFKGQSVQGRMPELMQALQNYSLEALLSFFPEDDPTGK